MLGCLPRNPGANQLTHGPAQSGLCIKAASQAETAKKLETEVEKLLGTEW